MNTDYLHSKTAIQFSYHINDDINFKVYSEFEIRTPSNLICKLFADSLVRYTYSKDDFFHEQGLYSLIIYFSSEKYGKDSISYDFDISAWDSSTEIILSLNNNIENDDSMPQPIKPLSGYLEINNYRTAPNTIDIKLNPNKESDVYNKGPYFTIKNNSKDTLYGRYFPGQFWGKLFLIDYVLSPKEILSIIDLNFAPGIPLYPDSNAISTVGSFGVSNNLQAGNYKYILLLSREESSIGIGEYLEKGNIKWWAETRNYYQLVYDFEIK